MIIDMTRSNIERNLTPKFDVTTFSSAKEFAKHISRGQKCTVYLHEPIGGNDVIFAKDFTCYADDEGAIVDFNDGGLNSYTLGIGSVFSILDRGSGYFYSRRSNGKWSAFALRNI